jgi:hypothetical protein
MTLKGRFLISGSVTFMLFSIQAGLGIISSLIGEDPVTSIVFTISFYLSVLLIMVLVARVPTKAMDSFLTLAAIILIVAVAISIIIAKWRGYAGLPRYGFEIDINPNWIGLFLTVAIVIVACSNMNLFYKSITLIGGLLLLSFTGSRAAVFSSALTLTIREGTHLLSKLSRKLAISFVPICFLGFAIATFTMSDFINRWLFQIADVVIDLSHKTLGIKISESFRYEPAQIEMGLIDREGIIISLLESYTPSFFGFGPRGTNIVLGNVLSKISHNSYISILYDYGIGGFVIIMWIILRSLFLIARRDIEIKKKLGIEGAVILCVGTFAAFHDVLTSFLSPSGILFWVSVCSIPNMRRI